MQIMIKSLWAFRGFIYGNVKREFQLKYRNSLLGSAWTILNPLAMIIVYTVIFSKVMPAKLPGIEHNLAYSIYLCAGVLTWGLFAEIVGRGQNIFLDNANLLKKINFPRLSLPIILIINALVNFSVIFSIFLVFLLLSNHWPGVVALASLPILIVELLFAIGLAITLGVLNVFFRDVGHFFGIFLQFWFWFTPVIYPVNILPESVKALMLYNPMFYIIQAYQSIFVNQQYPQWSSLFYPLVFGICLCSIGLHLYKKHVGEMVDEL